MRQTLVMFLTGTLHSSSTDNHCNLWMYSSLAFWTSSFDT